VNRRTIESVEQEVERLLEQDALADDVKYGKLLSTYMGSSPINSSQRSWTT
jgi:TATA-binding protein-associated factor Taf7